MFQRALPEVDGFGVITSTPGLDQVVPAGDVLRVALAHDEHHDRVAGHPLRRVGVPVARDDPVLDQPSHVGRGRERDHVGGLTRVDRAALGARGAERLAERHALAGGRLRERRGQRVVGLLRRRVGDQRELGRRSRCPPTIRRRRCRLRCRTSRRSRQAPLRHRRPRRPPARRRGSGADERLETVFSSKLLVQKLRFLN